MRRCGGYGLRWTEIEDWIHDYDNVQRLAVKLIYAQIGCALIGSLGVLYNGVLLVNLGISLFALVAIESSSQSLARTYAVLLFSSVVLDISWFFLFSHHIWHIPFEFDGTFFRFSVKLTLAMQIIGFSVRLSSLLLWMQMYRLGSDDAVGGSIYGSAYYSSLFEDGRDDVLLYGDGQNPGVSVVNSVFAAETAGSIHGPNFHAKDDHNAAGKFEMV